MLNFLRIIFFLTGLLWVATGFAAQGFGGVANEMSVPVAALSDFIGTTSIAIGLSCLFGAFIRYTQHRVNPLAVPISTVVVLFIVGCVLSGLPFIYKITQSGIPYGSSAHNTYR